MRKILSLFGMLSAAVLWGQSGLTGTEHYIYSKTCLNGDCTKASENVQYFDSFGRPFQSVGIKASPSGKDIVQHIPYDSHGRTADSWYPVPMNSMGGAVQDSSAVKANALSVYGDSRPFSHSVLENSPLSRVLSSVAPGQDWQNHPVTMGYNTNTAGEVKKYNVSTTWTQGRTEAVLSQPGDYPAGTLIRKTVTDEDQNTSVQFENKEGQLVLFRKGAGTATVTDTYYVYDEYGHLTYVIPPLAAVGAVSETVLNDLCYQYRYDGWHRLVEKKLPGKGWEYMAYDKADRLVMTQDANMRPSGKWMFTKYDKLSRAVYAGIAEVGAQYGREQVQYSIDYYINQGQPATEERNTTGFSAAGGVVAYYSNSVYPTTIDKVLSISYYDTYPQYSFNPAFPTAIQGETVLTDNFASDAGNTKGFPVMSLVKNIEDDNWTKSYSYFDTKGRVIGSYAINHLGGYTRTESKLDFAGLPQKTLARHKRLETDTERLITQTYEYDPQGRLLVHKHQVDNNPEEILTQNTYNELSQLTAKKVGGTNISQPLETIDYQYNVRGWLTKINDPANLNGKLFGYEIRYQNPVYTNKAAGRYNGNITEADWKNASENILKRYSYAYDGQNRLNTAFYAEPDTTNPHNGNYDEAMTYDLNGNIRTLKRKAFPVLGTTATLIDDLDYQYNGNRLNQVIESSMNDLGYEGGNNFISYDANGNMADMKDKGIHSIIYNLLDLPVYLSVTQGSGKTLRNGIIEYVYRADGTKLRKNYTLYGDRATGDAVRLTDYLDGFQYSYYNPRSTCPTCRTESAFEEQAYKNIGDDLPVTKTPEWKLDFVATAEGFYSFTENRYIYQYKDQLGNARVSFAQNSAGALEITDTNNYYPLGLNHTGGNGINNSKIGSYNSYKYNGKELQETGMFDYGARFYMPDLGRWGVVDPLAEQMRRHSPYNYAFNNPVNYIDPDGRQPYNPRNFYGEHSAFNGDFDSNSTLLYGTGSFGYTNFAALSFASGEQAGGGNTYYGQEAYNVLQNFLNPQYNFSQFNFSGPPNEYIVEMKTGQVRQISDLGGDEIDFFHYEGGKFNGKTRIVDRESGDDQWMNSSKNLKGYTRRMNSTGWAALFDEFLRGGGPENSLLVGKENAAVKQLMKTNMYKTAIDYFQGTSMNEKASFSGMFGPLGVVLENSNMQGQFMGKTNFSFYPVGNKVVIMAFDSKSASSYSLNPFNKSESVNIPRVNGVGVPESTTRQTYLLWINKNKMK